MNATTTCLRDDCDLAPVTRGYCHTHYVYARRHGLEVIRPLTRTKAADATCSADDCDRPTSAKGLCKKHDNQRRYHEARAARPPHPARPACETPGCTTIPKHPGATHCARCTKNAQRAATRQIHTTPDATRGTYTAVWPVYGGMTKARLRRIASIELTRMLGDDIALDPGDWTFTLHPSSTPDVEAYLIARRPATSTRPNADLTTSARALADAVRAEVPTLAAEIDARLPEEVAAA